MESPIHPPSFPLPLDDLKNLIIHSLDNDKAEDIVVIDLKGKSDIADYMIIATGRATRHVGSMADKLVDKLKKEAGISHVSIEGVPQCEWVLVDAFDIIVHLFLPETRAIYNLEKMWQMTLPE